MTDDSFYMSTPYLPPKKIKKIILHYYIINNIYILI